MSLNLSHNQNIIFDKTMELLIEQLMELNRKIDLLETKIDNIYINKIILSQNNTTSPINISEIKNTDWNSIHLY